MGMNVSDFVWYRLGEWGRGRIHGYPGDGVGPDVALERARAGQRREKKRRAGARRRAARRG